MTERELAVLAGLKEMRELLADESHWTKKVYARDNTGREVNSLDSGAVRWCLIGACNKVSGIEAMRAPLYADLIRALEKRVTHIPSYNDEHGHAAILALLDACIKDWQELAQIEEAVVD